MFKASFSSNNTKRKTYEKRLSLGKYATVDYETGEILGYTYCRQASKEELSRDIDRLVLDDYGCINGDDVGGMKDDPDFWDLLADDRYGDDF